MSKRRTKDDKVFEKFKIFRKAIELSNAYDEIIATTKDGRINCMFIIEKNCIAKDFFKVIENLKE